METNLHKYTLNNNNDIEDENGEAAGYVNVCPLFALGDEEEILNYEYIPVNRIVDGKRYSLPSMFVHRMDIHWYNLSHNTYCMNYILCRYKYHQCISYNHKGGSCMNYIKK